MQETEISVVKTNKVEQWLIITVTIICIKTNNYYKIESVLRLWLYLVKRMLTKMFVFNQVNTVANNNNINRTDPTNFSCLLLQLLLFPTAWHFNTTVILIRCFCFYAGITTKNSVLARTTAMKWTQSSTAKRDAWRKITSRPRPITQEDVGPQRLQNKWKGSLSQRLTIPVPARRQVGSCSRSVHKWLRSFKLMIGTML